MTEISDRLPVPNDLREAFEAAIEKFVDWQWESVEPEVSYQGRPWKIGGIFSLTESFSGQAPNKLHDWACKFADDLRSSNPVSIPAINISVPKDHTYAAVALSMRRLCEARWP